MTRLRILADDLTGALDCAAAFGPGVPVHLGRAGQAQAQGIDIVATATRDVPPHTLAEHLAPSLAWLRGADVALKKIDSLLRGNTFAEMHWLAQQAPFAALGVVPAFPAQQRLTQHGQQRWRSPDGAWAVAGDLRAQLQALGWRVDTGPEAPPPGSGPLAWVPDVHGDAELDHVAQHALRAGPSWLWCASAGLAHALARQGLRPEPPGGQAASTPAVAATADAARTEAAHADAAHADAKDACRHPLLVSASHHPVTRSQWQVLQHTPGLRCRHWDTAPLPLQTDAPGPLLLDLSPQGRLSAAQAAALLQTQARALAQSAPRPRVLVVVGGDTLLALCRALGATGLCSAQAPARAGWGCARLQGGRWPDLLCYTRSGAFGGPHDLLEMLRSV